MRLNFIFLFCYTKVKFLRSLLFKEGTEETPVKNLVPAFSRCGGLAAFAQGHFAADDLAITLYLQGNSIANFLALAILLYIGCTGDCHIINGDDAVTQLQAAFSAPLPDAIW